MSTYLQILVFSLGYGAIYASLANGLVLTYRATGIINFGMGATAMWGGYVYTDLRTDGVLVLPVLSIHFGSELGMVAALAIALLCACLLALMIFYGAYRPVRRAPVLAQVVVSIAVMLSMTALVQLRFGAEAMSGFQLGRVAVIQAGTFGVGDKHLPVTNVVIALAIIALSALVWAYLRYTRTGVATRAASGNERAAILMGYAPDRLALVAMLISTLLATAGVILASPILGLSPITYSLFVVQALAVMLVGKMSSIPVATLAGFLLALVQQLLINWTTQSWWPDWAKSGVDQLLPLIVVVIALVVLGNQLPARGSLQSIRLPDVTVPSTKPAAGLITMTTVGGLLVVTSGVWRFGITMSLIFALMALSFVVITGYLGQMSLAQLSFAGTAGFALSKFRADWGVPFFVSMLMCAALATILGVIVAVPALRIRGAQLAIVTLAASLAISRFIFNNYAFTPSEGNLVDAPELFGLDLARQQGNNISRLWFSIMVLVVTVMVVVLFVRVASGTMGRAFLAVRANERAATSSGIDVRLVKIVGFALSAFIAGIAGCLMGYATGRVSASSFEVVAGLSILAVAYLGGITSWQGALVAGALAPLGIVHTIVEHFWSTGDTYSLVAGLLLIVTAILNPTGVAGAVPKQFAHLRQLIAEHRHAAQPSEGASLTAAAVALGERSKVDV